MTATTVKTSKRTIDQLRAAYDLTFANFATDNAEVAKALNVSAATAGRLMGKLEKAGLVCSTDVNDEAQGSSRRGQFKHLTWQCWQTYDSIDAAEAANVFDAAFGVITNHPAEEITPATPEEETSMAAPTKTSKTAQARAAREAKAAAAEAAKQTEPEASTSTELATIPAAPEPTPKPEPDATQTGAQLMKDLSAQVKKAVRGAELKASPKGDYTTVKIGKTPVAYIVRMKGKVGIELRLDEAPQADGVEFKPDTKHPAFKFKTVVGSAEQFEGALTAIELAAARVAA